MQFLQYVALLLKSVTNFLDNFPYCCHILAKFPSAQSYTRVQLLAMKHPFRSFIVAVTLAMVCCALGVLAILLGGAVALPYLPSIVTALAVVVTVGISVRVALGRATPVQALQAWLLSILLLIAGTRVVMLLSQRVFAATLPPAGHGFRRQADQP